MEKIIIDSYYDLENKIKSLLCSYVEKEFKNKLVKCEDEKNYFNCLKISEASWIFNINSVHANRGDISSSSLQKIFHSIFKSQSQKAAETSEKTEEELLVEEEKFINFKNKFIEEFTDSLIVALNNQNELTEYIEKIDVKNGYLNISLKGRGKELLEKIKMNKNEKKKNKENEEDKNQFTVYTNFIFSLKPWDISNPASQKNSQYQDKAIY